MICPTVCDTPVHISCDRHSCWTNFGSICLNGPWPYLIAVLPVILDNKNGKKSSTRMWMTSWLYLHLDLAVVTWLLRCCGVCVPSRIVFMTPRRTARAGAGGKRTSTETSRPASTTGRHLWSCSRLAPRLWGGENKRRTQTRWVGGRVGRWLLRALSRHHIIHLSDDQHVQTFGYSVLS